MKKSVNKNIIPGFKSMVFDSQYTFRLILDAISRPGVKKIFDLNIDFPEGLYASTAALILTLFDYETSFFMDKRNEILENWIGFHCGSKKSDYEKDSVFGIFLDTCSMDITRFSPGTFERPDLSSTLIIQASKIETCEKKGFLKLKGPGVRDCNYFFAEDINKVVFQGRENFVFPLGIDLFFADAEGFVAIPRTTRIEGL